MADVEGGGPKAGDGFAPLEPAPPSPPAPLAPVAPPAPAGPVAPPGYPPPLGYPPPQWVASPPPRRFGRGAVIGAAVGGVVVGGLLTVAAIGVVAVFADDDELDDLLVPGAIAAEHGPISERGGAVDVGDCLAGDPFTADVTTQEDVVDCADGHGSEVIGIVSIPELTERPSDEDVDFFAEEACAMTFGDYVGVDYYDSDLFFYAVPPDGDAWDEGDRSLFCLLDSIDHHGGLGSARDSG